jgi:hypothetical protein
MQIRPPSAPGTRSKDTVRDSEARPARKAAWHAVSIVTPTSCCSAASELRNHRFLSKDAPRLPLAGCPSPETCRCIYRHYADRRGKPRRGNDRGDPPKGGNPTSERRGRRGRRSTDNIDEE